MFFKESCHGTFPPSRPESVWSLRGISCIECFFTDEETEWVGEAGRGFIEHLHDARHVTLLVHFVFTATLWAKHYDLFPVQENGGSGTEKWSWDVNPGWTGPKDELRVCHVAVNEAWSLPFSCSRVCAQKGIKSPGTVAQEVKHRIIIWPSNSTPNRKQRHKPALTRQLPSQHCSRPPKGGNSPNVHQQVNRSMKDGTYIQWSIIQP